MPTAAEMFQQATGVNPVGRTALDAFKEATGADPSAPEWQQQPAMAGQPAVADWQSLSAAAAPNTAGLSPEQALSQRTAVQEAYQRQYGGYVGPTAGQAQQANLEQQGGQVVQQQMQELNPIENAARAGLNQVLQLGPAMVQAITPNYNQQVQTDLHEGRSAISDVLGTDPNRTSTTVGRVVGGAVPALAGGAGIAAMTMEAAGNFRNSVQEERAKGVQISGQAELAGAAASAANTAITQLVTRGLLTKLGLPGAVQAIRPAVLRTLTNYAAQSGMGALDNAAMQLIDNQINNAVLEHQRSATEGVGEAAAVGGLIGPAFDIHGRLTKGESLIPEYKPRGDAPSRVAGAQGAEVAGQQQPPTNDSLHNSIQEANRQRYAESQRRDTLDQQQRDADRQQASYFGAAEGGQPPAQGGFSGVGHQGREVERRTADRGQAGAWTPEQRAEQDAIAVRGNAALTAIPIDPARVAAAEAASEARTANAQPMREQTPAEVEAQRQNAQNVLEAARTGAPAPAYPEPTAPVPSESPRVQAINAFIDAIRANMEGAKGNEKKDLQDKILIAEKMLEKAREVESQPVKQQESASPEPGSQSTPESTVTPVLQERASSAGGTATSNRTSAPSAPSGLKLGEKQNPKDMFGREIIGKGTGEQQPLYHEPTQYQPPAQERLGSKSANDPAHTPSMFEKTAKPKSLEQDVQKADDSPSDLRRQTNFEQSAATSRKPAPKKGTFSKGDIEERIQERYRTEHGERLSAHDENELARFGGINGAFWFHGKLPGEVKTFLEGRAYLRRVFKIAPEGDRNVHGEDAMHELGDAYWRIAETMGAKKDAVGWAAKHPDPQLNLLAQLHGIVSKGPKEIIDPSQEPTGTKFKVGGHDFEIVTGEDGHRLLKDGQDFDPLPADQVGKVPADKGTLERGVQREPGADEGEAPPELSSGAAGFVPFSPREEKYSAASIEKALREAGGGNAKIMTRRPPKILTAAADAVERVLGAQVVHVEGGKFAGVYDRKRGLIYIDAKRPLKSWVRVFAHEWMHSIQDADPAIAKQFYEAIPEKRREMYLRQYINDFGGQKAFDAYRLRGAADGNDVVAMEVGAMAMMDAANRGRIQRAIMGQDPTAWQRITDALSTLWDKFRGHSVIVDEAFRTLEAVKAGDEPQQLRAGDNPFRTDDRQREFMAALPAPSPGKPDDRSTWEKVKEKADFAIDGLNRLSGRQFPTMTRVARETGEAAGRYAASIPYVLNATPAIARRVVGHLEGMKDMNGVEPRRILGALLTQDKLDWIRQKWNERADQAEQMERDNPDLFGGTDIGAEFRQRANEVHSLVGTEGSPFKTQADFDAALADPHIQNALKAWDEWFKAGPDKDYQIAQHIQDPELIEQNARGLRTGIQVNLKAIDPEGADKPVGPIASRQGNLTNARLRKSPFAREAKGTGEAYETDPEQLIANTLRGGYEPARLHELYAQMAKDRVARVGRPGEKIAGYVPLEIESAKRFVNRTPGGETKGFTLPAKMLYVKAEVMPELRNALRVDEHDLAKTVNKFARPFNVATLASFREAAYHLGNGLTMFSKPGTGFVIDRLAGHLFKMAVNSPEIGERMAELARIGAAREPARKPNWNPFTWTGKLLDSFDKAGRLMLDDAFSSMSEKGLVKNTETNRRDFINQMGNYNKRAQSLLVRAGRESGIAPFATAGTNYLAQAIRMHALSPGVTATSPAAAMRLRAEVAGRLLLPLVGVAVANYLRWGKVDGASNIPLGALRLADDDQGRPRYIDIAALEGVTRALRASGSLPWIDKLIRGNRGAESADSSVKSVLQSFSSPLMGPAARALSTAATGKDVPGIGRQKAAKAGPGESQFAENFKAAGIGANPIAEYLHGLWSGQAEVGDIGQELGRFGVKHAFGPERTNAESMMSNLQRERFGDTPMTPAQGEHRKMIDQYVDRVRKEGYKPVDDARMAGTLTAADEQTIKRKLSAPSVDIDKFKGLTVQDAMRVWKEAASEDDKRQFGPYLLSKIDKSKSIPEQQKAAMMREVQSEFDRVSQQKRVP